MKKMWRRSALIAGVIAAALIMSGCPFGTLGGGGDDDDDDGEEPNTAPVAIIDFSPQEPAVDDTVRLSAERSTDQDEDALSFLWELVSAPANSATSIQNALQEKATLTVDAAGSYLVRLTVNDGADTASETQEIQVSATSVGTQVEITDAPGGLIISDDQDLTIVVGETPTLGYRVVSGDGGVTVSWSSDDPSVVTVDTGTITGVAAGSAQVTATPSSGIADTITVTVVGDAVALESIALEPITKTTAVGSSFPLSVVYTPSDTTQRGVDFESANPSVAKVDASGVVEAVGVGTATITATASGDDSIRAEMTVDVQDAESQAVVYFYDGLSYLENGQPDLAFNAFSNAVDADPQYMPAILGYSMMNMAAITVDQDVQTFAVDTLGLSDYPQTMGAAFSEQWLELVTIDGYDHFWPAVDGATDMNNDGYVTMEERAVALAENMMSDNGNLNAIAGLAAAEINDRLGATIGLLNDVSNSTTFTLTWDMYDLFGNEEDAINHGWPAIDSNNDNSLDQALEVTIGKAEAQLMQAQLHFMKSFAHLSVATDYTLALQDYWNNYIEISWVEDGSYEDGGYFDVTFDYPSEGPFAGSFLSDSAEAQAAIDDARQEMLDGTASYVAALSEIAKRSGTDFFLDQQNPFWNEVDVLWSDITNGMKFAENTAIEIADSIENETPAYFPVDFMDFSGPQEFLGHYADTANWPTSADLYFDYDTSTETETFTAKAAALNFGVLYAGPLGGIHALLDLDEVGEPVWYTADNDAETGAVTGFSEATSYDATEVYYLRFPDLTFGGAVPIENISGANGSVSNLNSELQEAVGTSTASDVMFWLQDNGSGGVEVFLMDMAMAAGHSFTAQESSFDVAQDGTTETFTSTGSYWWAVGEAATSMFGPILGGTTLSADGFEPDDSVETATYYDPLNPGFDYHSLAPEGDIDWYRVEGLAGYEVIFATYGLEGSRFDTDTVVYLDQDGDLNNGWLDRNDDDGNSLFSRLSYVFLDNAPYYYAVEEYDKQIGEYEMEMWAQPVLVKDGSEPDHDLQALNPIPLPSFSTQRNFFPAGDMDYFRIDVQESSVITVTVTGNEQTPYPVSGDVSVYLTDDGNTENPLAQGIESLSYNFSTAGTYYIVIGAEEGHVGEYFLEVY